MKKCRSLDGTRCNHPIVTNFGKKSGLNAAKCDGCNYFYASEKNNTEKI